MISGMKCNILSFYHILIWSFDQRGSKLNSPGKHLAWPSKGCGLHKDWGPSHKAARFCTPGAPAAHKARIRISWKRYCGSLFGPYFNLGFSQYIFTMVLPPNMTGGKYFLTIITLELSHIFRPDTSKMTTRARAIYLVKLQLKATWGPNFKIDSKKTAQ